MDAGVVAVLSTSDGIFNLANLKSVLCVLDISHGNGPITFGTAQQ